MNSALIQQIVTVLEFQIGVKILRKTVSPFPSYVAKFFQPNPIQQLEDVLSRLTE